MSIFLSKRDKYRVAQDKMSHWTKCNFSTTNRNYSIKIWGFKGERFSNLGNCQCLDNFKHLNFQCYFLNADKRFNNCYFFINFYRENFCNTQIIMTSSIPDKAKVNAKRYVETLLPMQT